MEGLPKSKFLAVDFQVNKARRSSDALLTHMKAILTIIALPLLAASGKPNEAGTPAKEETAAGE